MESGTDYLRALVRAVPDFPHPGILFRDITPLLAEPGALAEVTRAFADRYGGRIDVVVGVESRGFLFGAPLAAALNVGFVPVRKLGKLPGDRLTRPYGLEYGAGHLEMHQDALRSGQRVLLIDDLLATGGTAEASASMIRELAGEVVEAAFLIELEALDGRSRLAGLPVFSLLRY